MLLTLLMGAHFSAIQGQRACVAVSFSSQRSLGIAVCLVQRWGFCRAGSALQGLPPTPQAFLLPFPCGSLAWWLLCCFVQSEFLCPRGDFSARAVLLFLRCLFCLAFEVVSLGSRSPPRPLLVILLIAGGGLQTLEPLRHQPSPTPAPCVSSAMPRICSSTHSRGLPR